MAGFIAIERDLWDHQIFAPSPMSEREAWMWMIARAAWAGTQHRVGANMFDVARGSFMATLREMQSVFMWPSDKKVRNFLKKLENHGMIAVLSVGERNARKTHVTICNYDEYQTLGRSKDAAKTHGGRTEDAVKKPRNQGTISPPNGGDGEVVDFEKEVFERAVAYLGRHGTEERQARSFVGLLRKDYEARDIFDAFFAAGKAGVTDPIPWVRARLGQKAEAFKANFDLSKFEDQA